MSLLHHGKKISWSNSNLHGFGTSSIELQVELQIIEYLSIVTKETISFAWWICRRTRKYPIMSTKKAKYVKSIKIGTVKCKHSLIVRRIQAEIEKSARAPLEMRMKHWAQFNEIQAVTIYESSNKHVLPEIKLSRYKTLIFNYWHYRIEILVVHPVDSANPRRPH